MCILEYRFVFSSFLLNIIMAHKPEEIGRITQNHAQLNFPYRNKIRS